MRDSASSAPAYRNRAGRSSSAKGASATGGAPAASTTAHSASGGGWVAGLRQRLLSALVLIPIAVALVWFGGWVAFAGALVTLVLTTLELRAMFAHKGWYPPLILSLLLSIDFLVAAMLPGARLALVGIGISALLIVSFGYLMLVRPTIERTLIDWGLAMAMPFYVGWPMGLFLMLRGNGAGRGATGFWWVLALFVIIWANDSAAFVTGHFFGRHKMAPHISPAKTWEGFAGGMVLAVIASLVLTIPLHIGWYNALAIGILTGIAGTLGDLAESLLKRGTGVKDSGTVIPGHGGILDRVDSLLFAVMVVFFYAAFLHGIAY